MTEPFQRQYDLVRDSRVLLFEFIESAMGDAGIVAPVSAYMGKSVRDLLVHSASCYFNWLAYVAMGQTFGSMPEHCATLRELRALYSRVDETMDLFLRRFSGAMEVSLSGVQNNGWRVIASPCDLFTHVTTHEFHHKGQIVVMARLLGHAPPDTDVSNSFPELPPEKK